MNRISSEAITSDRFKSEMIDLRLIISIAANKAAVSFARMRHHLRYLFAARQPPWLGDVDWAWPTWREPRRPFDYKRECSSDFTRQFPPIAGGGRGYIMGEPVKRDADDNVVTRAQFVRELLCDFPELRQSER